MKYDELVTQLQKAWEILSPSPLDWILYLSSSHWTPLSSIVETLCSTVFQGYLMFHPRTSCARAQWVCVRAHPGQGGRRSLFPGSDENLIWNKNKYKVRHQSTMRNGLTVGDTVILDLQILVGARARVWKSIWASHHHALRPIITPVRKEKEKQLASDILCSYK